MTGHHGLEPVTVEDLDELDRRFQEAFRTGRAPDLEVLGYGEVSTVVLWPTSRGPAACKRLPPFPDFNSFEEFRELFDDYFRIVEGAGIALVPSSLASLPGPNGAVSAFVIQPALSPAELLPSVLSRAGDDEAVSFFDNVFAHLANAIDAGAGVDGQVSNWGIRNGTLVYFDVTTPFLRGEGGKQRYNADHLIASLPWVLRGFVKRFMADSIMDTYHERRASILDVLGNLIKERLGRLLPVAMERANRFLDPPVSEPDVERYYRSDARLWEFLIRIRRLDRFWQLKVRRRPYPFLLPGPTER